MVSVYDRGDLVQVSCTFVNEDGEPADPTAVYCDVTDPFGTVTTYEYGEDLDLTQVDTGIYALEISADEIGWWGYRFYSTGVGQAAASGRFWVDV